jgi:hypothetical protein
MHLHHALALPLLLTALLPQPAAAATDTAVAGGNLASPIAARDGVVAWSVVDSKARTARLMIRTSGGEVGPANVKPSKTGFDVSVGKTATGTIVALYSRCTKVTSSRVTGCDVYRYDVTAKTEQKVTAVSSPHEDEAWPAQDGNRIAFVRRATAGISDKFDSPYFDRPVPQGRKPDERVDCDIPYVRDLSSDMPSRRLDRGQCISASGVAIRGTTIAVTGESTEFSSARLLSVRGGRSREIENQGYGEGGSAPLHEPRLSDSALYTLREGARADAPPAFLRFDLRTHAETAVDPQVNLAGGFARDEDGTVWYSEAPPASSEEDSTGGPSCDNPLAPCLLVRAAADPFGGESRGLLPEIGVDTLLDGEQLVSTGPDTVLAGGVTSRVVQKGRVVGTTPVAGVVVDIEGKPIAVNGEPQSGPAAKCQAGSTDVTTDASGHWSLSLTGLEPNIAYCQYQITVPALQLGFPTVTVYGKR